MSKILRVGSTEPQAPSSFVVQHVSAPTRRRRYFDAMVSQYIGTLFILDYQVAVVCWLAALDQQGKWHEGLALLTDDDIGCIRQIEVDVRSLMLDWCTSNVGILEQSSSA